MGLTLLYFPTHRRHELREAIIAAGIQCENLPDSIGEIYRKGALEVWRCRENGFGNFVIIRPPDDRFSYGMGDVPEGNSVMKLVMDVGILGLFRLKKIEAAQSRLISVLTANGATYLWTNHLADPTSTNTQ